MAWSRTAGLCIAMLGLVGTHARGQVSAAATASDTSTFTWARRLLDARHAQQALVEGLDSAFAAQRRSGNEKLPAIFFDSLTARARRDASSLIDSMAVIWAGQLTLQELQQLVQFYESPLGKRYAAAETAVELRTNPLAQRWGAREAIDVLRDLMDKGLIQDFAH